MYFRTFLNDLNRESIPNKAMIQNGVQHLPCCLCVSLCVSLALSLSLSLSLYLSVSLSLCLSVSLFCCLSVSVYLVGRQPHSQQV